MVVLAISQDISDISAFMQVNTPCWDRCKPHSLCFTDWWFLPSWKIWVRQLGWMMTFPIYGKVKIHVPNHQPVSIYNIYHISHQISLLWLAINPIYYGKVKKIMFQTTKQIPFVSWLALPDFNGPNSIQQLYRFEQRLLLAAATAIQASSGYKHNVQRKRRCSAQLLNWHGNWARVLSAGWKICGSIYNTSGYSGKFTLLSKGCSGHQFAAHASRCCSGLWTNGKNIATKRRRHKTSQNHGRKQRNSSHQYVRDYFEHLLGLSFWHRSHFSIFGKPPMESSGIQVTELVECQSRRHSMLVE